VVPPNFAYRDFGFAESSSLHDVNKLPDAINKAIKANFEKFFIVIVFGN
jgi:hypothetical protein